MSPDVRTFADAQARAFRSTESYLEHLAGQYDRVIRAAGVRAATKFSELALTAAGWDESKHPRESSGTPGGGRFRSIAEVEAANPDVEMWANEGRSGITLSKIKTEGENRGQGKASKALKDLTDYADSTGQKVALTVGHDVEDRGLSKAQKVEWYRRHGFVPNKGRNKDFAFTETMIRQPETTTTAAAGDPPWEVPALDDLIDVTSVTQELLGATETTRKAAASSATRPILSAMGVSFSLEAPMVKDLVGRTGVRAAALSIPGLQDAVRDAITTAFAEGLSVPQTAALIAQKANGLATYQSEMLARTDLIGTANGGSLLAAKAVWPEGGVVKRWTNATNSRTENDGHIRPTHLEANGQVVGLDDSFLVGDDELLFPGDPGGSDAEVCNCRCSIVYEETGVAAAGWDETRHPRHGKGSDRGGEFAPKPTGDVVNKMDSRHHAGAGKKVGGLYVGDRFYLVTPDGPKLYEIVDTPSSSHSIVKEVDNPAAGYTHIETGVITEEPTATPMTVPPSGSAPPEGAIEVTGRTLKAGSTFWGQKRGGEWVKYEVVDSAGGLGRYVRVKDVATGQQMVMKASTKVSVDPDDFPAAAKRAAKVDVNHVEGEYGKAFGKSPGPGTKVTKAANVASAETGELLTINTNEAKAIPLVETRSETFGGAIYVSKMRTTGEYIPQKLALRAGDPAEMRDNMHHEMGHYIDYVGLDTVMGQTASDTRHPDFAGPVMDAIDGSRAMERINSMRQRERGVGTAYEYSVVTNNGLTGDRSWPTDQQHLSYLAAPTEKFARAYEQYVATKTAERTGDTSRLERYRRDAAAPLHVKRMTESGGTSFKGFYGWYWDGDDFVPIMRAFDDMFGRAGWLKN